MAGTDDFPGLGLAHGDHAIGGRAQLAVRGLVASHLQLGAGRVHLSLGRDGGGVLRIHGRAADQLLVGQRREARAIGAGATEFCFSCSELRAGSAGAGLQIAGVQGRQHVALLHVVADIDPALDQLSGDPERQRAFLTGADLAGQRAETVGGRGRTGYQHRTRRLDFRRLGTTPHHQSSSKQPRHQHPEDRPG